MGQPLMRKRFAWLAAGVMLLLLALAALPGPAVADSEAWANLFAQANGLYEQGRYAEAIERYAEIVAAGVADGRVHYNLGNAYYQTGQLGKAILSYERARRLLPRDEDVQANLALARSQVATNPGLAGVDSLSAWAGLLFGRARADELAWLAWGTYMAGLLCALAGVLWRRARRAGLGLAGALAVLTLLLLASLGLGVHAQERLDHAVVIAGPASVYSGPAATYTQEVTLAEGAEVVIVEAQGEWCRLHVATDLQGWAACNALESVHL